MVTEAEKYRGEDEQARERVNTRNHLETYVYSCKLAVQNYTGTALTDAEKSTVLNGCEETQKWLEANLLVDKDELDHRYSELEKKYHRIMAKMHTVDGDKHHNGNGCHNGSNGFSIPRVEEVE